jgi:hypothetical protein
MEIPFKYICDLNGLHFFILSGTAVALRVTKSWGGQIKYSKKGAKNENAGEKI